jgi:hypothetical protein
MWHYGMVPSAHRSQLGKYLTWLQPVCEYLRTHHYGRQRAAGEEDPVFEEWMQRQLSKVKELKEQWSGWRRGTEGGEDMQSYGRTIGV